MGKTIKVTLPEGWIDETRRMGKGVLTYVRKLSETPGALQMSLLAVQQGGDEPRPSVEDLTKIAMNGGKLIECSKGPCSMGTYGSVVFVSQDASRTQIWWISNGLDSVTVTHICNATPDPVEMFEADKIATTVEIAEE